MSYHGMANRKLPEPAPLRDQSVEELLNGACQNIQFTLTDLDDMAGVILKLSALHKDNPDVPDLSMIPAIWRKIHQTGQTLEVLRFKVKRGVK